MPRKNRLYRGSLKEVKSAPGGVLPLLAHSGNCLDLFFPRCWSPGATERRLRLEEGQAAVHVIERPGIFKRLVRRYVMNPESPVCDVAEIYDIYQKKMGLIHFKDYRFPGPVAGKEDDAPLAVTYPGRITLAAPDHSRSLQMDVEELILNVPVPDKKFRIDVPDDVQAINLGEALRDPNKSIWD